MEKTTVTPNPHNYDAPISADNLTGRLIGGCLIGTKLGQGGMGAVYKAFHQALDIPVAVKVLLPYPGMGKEAAGRFIREARAAAKLRHPNITGVLNVGEEQGISFIVMELLPGGSLQSMLDAHGSLPPYKAVAIVLQVLDGLTLAFENRIVHRDIKPDNILFDDHGVAKLSDLGLAKQVGYDLSITQSGVTMGSPNYMAPEQANDFSKADHRADIYSLGCVLYHVLAGKPPYGGKTHLEIILKHINEPTPDLKKAAPDIDSGLAAIVRRMMAKSPDDRFQTPMEAIASLHPFIVNSKIPLLLSTKFSVRRLILYTIATVLVVAAIIATAMLRPHKEISYNDKNKNLNTIPLNNSMQIVQKRNNRTKTTNWQAVNQQETVTRSPATSSTRQGVKNPLMSAVKNGRNKDIKNLLNRGAQPNFVENGITPLHFAVSKGNAEAVRILLEKGANPSAIDNNGDSPLHIAIRSGNGVLVQNLLNFGANPNIPDSRGMTPLQLADIAGNGEMMRMLREHGAN